jgi:LysM repeat protein
MTFTAPLPRTLLRGLLAGLALTLAACRTPSRKIDLSQDVIATPPHRMSRAEYPFDASGRYIDAWAAEGATRYGRFINTDRTEDNRSDTAEPERRPPPPPRPVTTATPPRPRPERAESTANRPPTRPREEPSSRAGTRRPATPEARPTTAAKPVAKPVAKPAAKPAAKPKPPPKSGSTAATKAKTAAKPPSKKAAAPAKPATHTVRRGDSLSSLSQRYGVSVLELKKANRLSSDRIIDGRKLVIPKK